MVHVIIESHMDGHALSLPICARILGSTSVLAGSLLATDGLGTSCSVSSSKFDSTRTTMRAMVFRCVRTLQ
jgi:hypothetical protein